MLRQLAILCFFLLALPTQGKAEGHPAELEPQNSIWFQNPVGHVVVGASGDENSTQIDLAYVYYFAAIGPKPTPKTEAYGICLKKSVIDQGKKFRSAIGNHATLWPDQLRYDPEWLEKTDAELRAAEHRFKTAASESCIKSGNVEELRQYLKGTRLAIVKRECSSKDCPWMRIPALTPKGKAHPDDSELSFESVFYWSKQKSIDQVVNQVVILEFPTAAPASGRVVEVRRDSSIYSPEPLPVERKAIALERGIKLLQKRRDDWLLSPTVAAQIGLPKKTVLRVANSFADPKVAYELGIESDPLILRNIEDEVARIRLHECARFRGLTALDHISSCAGYKLDQQQLFDCLNGRTCMPDFSAQADAGAMLLSSRRNVAQAAIDAMIPRPFSDAANSFGKIVADYKKCAVPNAPVDKVETCAALAQVPPEIAQQAQCLLSKQNADRLACIIPSGETRQVLDRFQSCIKSGKSNCAVFAAIPAELDCAAKANTAVAAVQCLSASNADAARIAGCFAGGQSQELIAKLQCLAGDKIPPELACLANGGSEAAIAACALGNSLKPEQAILLQCAMQSGGDVMSAGVCMATPHLKLNPGQQIMLQCAMSSGGEPITFAGCTIGRFTLRELNGCTKTDFGNSGCFGENNEFQRLAKALTGSNISKSSVVGQLAVAHIDAANAAIAGVGNVLGQARDGIDRVGRGVGREIEKFKDNPIGIIARAPENIVNEVGKGITQVGSDIERSDLNPRNWKL
jgi:hypothetical protein